MGNRDPRSHRYYLEILVDLIFQCTDEQYLERIPRPPIYLPFEYPRYSYIPRELKRKQIDELLQLIKGIPGRPKDCKPVFTPLRSHKHIPISKQGCYIIYR
jgi:hypothetical protein